MKDLVYFAEHGAVAEIARALDSDLRRRILELLVDRSMNINEIAQALGIPQSTCAVNVQILEQARLLACDHVAATKGAQKRCSLAFREVVLPLRPPAPAADACIISVDMPIGLFTDHQVAPPCGLLNETGVIGYYDHSDAFANPKRAGAGLIWMAKGFLEYRFPKERAVDAGRIAALSVSIEVCSEFPGYKNEWPSDITVWINGQEIGTWTSPGDFGGKYGLLTPRWWDLMNTQYGLLKTWRVSESGCQIDGVTAGAATLGDLRISELEYFTVRIGVKDDAAYPGGFNLFGRCFGNYEQDIVLRVELKP